MNYTHYLAGEIRAEAARKQISVRKLAVAVEEANGLSWPTVQRMMTGKRAWDVNSLSAVAKVLDTSVAELVGRADAVYRCNLPLLSVATFAQVSALCSAP